MAALECEIVPYDQTFLPPENSHLTTKQNLFVHYYLEHRNGVKAAQLAGYKGDVNTLNQSARANLQNPTIREAIESYYKARLLSSDGVLAELSDIASAPWKDFVEVKYGEDGQVIQAILRPADKIKSLELVGKFHKLFTEKVETETSINESDSERLADQLAQSLLAAISRKQLENKE